MTTEILTPIRLRAGRYEGRLSAQGCDGIEAVHLGRVIAAAHVDHDPAAPGEFRVAVDIPASILADGVQVIALKSVSSGQVLDRITVLAGAPLDEDIRAELALLRDEVEMLKTAFRRHASGA